LPKIGKYDIVVLFGQYSKYGIADKGNIYNLPSIHANPKRKMTEFTYDVQFYSGFHVL